MAAISLTDVARAVSQQKGYVFVGRVGEGASKETFHVRLPSGESIALKVLRPNCSMHRIHREIEAMARCDHPNIGKFYSIEHSSYLGTGYRFITEEFVEGGSLLDRLSAGPMARDEVLDLGEALISAISHIESLGLVHRDLAPKNIMFRSDNKTPVVVDFGLVRDLAQPSLTNAWQMVGPGTPLYASPEQLNNQKSLINWRADQFGLGVVLAECAFGYHPFARSADTFSDIVQRVANRETPSPRFEADCIACSLQALVKMVSPWPTDRFRRPEQLLHAWLSQR